MNFVTLNCADDESKPFTEIINLDYASNLKYKELDPGTYEVTFYFPEDTVIFTTFGESVYSITVKVSIVGQFDPVEFSKLVYAVHEFDVVDYQFWESN